APLRVSVLAEDPERSSHHFLTFEMNLCKSVIDDDDNRRTGAITVIDSAALQDGYAKGFEKLRRDVRPICNSCRAGAGHIAGLADHNVHPAFVRQTMRDGRGLNARDLLQPLQNVFEVAIGGIRSRIPRIE